MEKLGSEFWEEARKEIPRYPGRFSLNNRNSVLDSMRVFTDKVNQSGFLDRLIRRRLIHGREAPPGEFCLSEPITQRLWANFDDADFFLDGHYSWALGYKENNSSPLWFAVLGLKSLDRLYDHDTENVIEEFSDLHMTIVMLQGPASPEMKLPTYRSWGKYQQAVDTLRLLRWEFSLIDVPRCWAISVGIPDIYLQSSYLNEWRTNENLKTNLHLRYDVTAKKYGLELTSSQLWRLQV